MRVRRLPHPRLRRQVTAYFGFEEHTGCVTQRREGPGSDVVIILSFGNEWLIDSERRDSFVGGLRRSQVTTEHAGWSCGMHIGLVPWAAHSLLSVPMHELAATTVPVDHFLPTELLRRLEDAPSWNDRFALLEMELAQRFVDAPHVFPGVVWAWERLRQTQGTLRVGALAEELGWSRKRLVARFREQVGLPPKAVARLLRFERARALAGTMSWSEIAFECGFSDQPHLVAEFRSFTGSTPETFLQDTARQAA